MQAIVLAAGKGTRMRSEIPKVLQDMLGRPMLAHVLEVLVSIGVRDPIVVIGSGADQVRSFLKDYAKRLSIRPRPVLQSQQKGTGHAVMMAIKHLPLTKDAVLIWPGDMPLLKTETLRQFTKDHSEANADVSVLSAIQANPVGYGRILRSGGKFFAIREELDASDRERRIQEVNTGVYLFRRASLVRALKKIRPANKKSEYYLTDTIEILSQDNAHLEAFPFAVGKEAQGINSRADLSIGIGIMNHREVQRHQEQGVTFVCPEQTVVEPGVKIGKDTIIYPWSYIETGVTIGEKCKIGPFAKLRKGSHIDDESVIGSFVEVARSKVGKKVMAKHLAYLGDAMIGDETNIGAGTIFANFDGKRKHQSRLGKKVMVGSNTVFVSPVNIGDHARTGAGAVVTAGTKVQKKQIVAGVPAKPLKPKQGKKS